MEATGVNGAHSFSSPLIINLIGYRKRFYIVLVLRESTGRQASCFYGSHAPSLCSPRNDEEHYEHKLDQRPIPEWQGLRVRSNTTVTSLLSELQHPLR
ncbi:MAG: hypothetical protein ABSF09_13405 [Candidatus Bathyarchaeia archaeon]